MEIMLNSEDLLSGSYLRYREMFEASDKYDVIIDKATARQTDMSQFKKALILERQDCASLWFRNFLVMENVTGALKMFHYHDVEINNRPVTGGRLFVDDPDNAKVERIQVEQEHIDKIMPGFSFFHNPRFCNFFSEVLLADLRPIKERPVDLMFAGTTDFDPTVPAGKWITDKRLLCVDNINRLSDDLNVLAVDGRGLSTPEYRQALLDTKIFLSPLGTGEYCGKDFEALMSGCIVVKPTLPGYCTFNPDYHDDIVYIDNFDQFGLVDFHDIMFSCGDGPRDHIRAKLLDAKKNEVQIVKDILK